LKHCVPRTVILWHYAPVRRARKWEVTVPLNPNVHQGLHGEGFIHAMACSAGFTTSKMNLDVDGVDWQLAYPGPRGTTRSPKIEIQVKTESKPNLDDGVFRHRLSVRHYNFLAGRGFQIPRYLALVLVPRVTEEYAVCDHENMRLATAGYWLSLADRDLIPEGPDEAKSVSVLVPKRNLLSVKALTALLDNDLDGAIA
jgi:hypothetical protein